MKWHAETMGRRAKQKDEDKKDKSRKAKHEADQCGTVTAGATQFRLFSHTIRNRILDPSHLPVLLRSIRAALFPNNAPGTPTLVAPSSNCELRALRRRCASAIWGLVPTWLSRLYFSGRGGGRLGSFVLGRFFTGPSSNDSLDDAGDRDAESGVGGGAPDGDEQRELDRILSEIEEGVLDVFSDEYCNRHLLYSALELILVRLMPELADRGVAELLDERLSL